MQATLAVQPKRASNEQQRDWPITTQVVGRGTQCQSGRWACLKFHRCHSGQGFQRRNLHDEGVGKIAWIFCTAKTCPTSYHGKGWNSARLLHQKEIEVGERIDLSSNSVATTDISSVSSIADAED